MNVKRLLKQTAVYWSSPVQDGRGGFAFSEPVEISCRWEGKTEKFVTPEGREEVSRSIVYIDSKLDTDGWLLLGVLDDCPENASDPRKIAGAYKIRQSGFSTSVDGKTSLHKLWL